MSKSGAGMTRIATILTGVMLSLASSLSMAQTMASLEITWSAPTKRLDGSALAISEIEKYTLYERGASTIKITDLASTATAHTIRVAPGTHRYFMVVTDKAGLVSGASEDAVATVAAPTASGPGKVSLQIRVIIP